MRENGIETIFPKRLKAAMKEKDVGIRQIAKALDIAPSSVSRWTRGEVLPNIRLLPGSCRELEVSAGWLIGAENKSQQA